MRNFLALSLVLAAVPTVVLAQSPGLDLSEPPKDEKRDEREQPAKTDAPSGSPGLDLSEPPVPPPPAPEGARPPEAPASPGAKEQLPFSEKDVALGDKVKAVQRKGFLKKGRFEVAPIFSATVNDAFFQKFGGGLRLAWNVQDTFALALRGTYYTPYRADAVRQGKLAFQSQLLSSQLYYQAMADGIWSPIYGKAAFLGRNIVHFDLFLAAGVGAVWTATSLAPRNEGPHLAVDLGGGVRFYPKEWLAFELGVMSTVYPDQPVESVPGTMQNVLSANVGFSFFFPTRFQYEYP